MDFLTFNKPWFLYHKQHYLTQVFTEAHLGHLGINEIIFTVSTKFIKFIFTVPQTEDFV